MCIQTGFTILIEINPIKIYHFLVFINFFKCIFFIVKLMLQFLVSQISIPIQLKYIY